MNIINISRIVDDGNKEEKVIYELAEKDRYKHHPLGQAIGININHCVILGLKHKDNFWHRVYGYNIVQNEKVEKMLSKGVKEIGLGIEAYITVAFYERFANRKVMFIPKRLEIPDRPELNNFPFNIAFCTVTLTDNNAERQETSLYEPDFSTFIQEGYKQKIKYYNVLNLERYFWIEIIYDISNRGYIGTKYCGDKSVGIASGSQWDMFFAHFTALGVTSNGDA